MFDCLPSTSIRLPTSQPLRFFCAVFTTSLYRCRLTWMKGKEFIRNVSAFSCLDSRDHILCWPGGIAGCRHYGFCGRRTRVLRKGLAGLTDSHPCSFLRKRALVLFCTARLPVPAYLPAYLIDGRLAFWSRLPSSMYPEPLLRILGHVT